MESSFQHKVLIVDNDDSTGRQFISRLEQEKIEPVFAHSAESALKIIKTADFRFSVIITEQRLNKMTGAQFLEQTKPLTPLTSLFIMAGKTDIKTIIEAVNKGLIHRYIAKPLEENDFIATIKSGIDLCGFLFNNKKLMRLAKIQNTKLYELDCELMEKTKTHNKTIQVLEEEIRQLKSKIQMFSTQQPVPLDLLSGDLTAYLAPDETLDTERLDALFQASIQALYRQFADLALRNGFEMPGPGSPSG